MLVFINDAVIFVEFENVPPEVNVFESPTGEDLAVDFVDQFNEEQRIELVGGSTMFGTWNGLNFKASLETDIDFDPIEEN